MQRIYSAGFMQPGQFALGQLELDGEIRNVALIEYDGNTYMLSYRGNDLECDGKSVPENVRGCFDFSWVFRQTFYDFYTSVDMSGLQFEDHSWGFLNFSREPTAAEAKFFEMFADGENTEQ